MNSRESIYINNKDKQKRISGENLRFVKICLYIHLFKMSYWHLINKINIWKINVRSIRNNKCLNE